MASVYGKKLKLSIFGESHGDGIGVVIDGFPAGMKLDYDFINSQLKRRAPGGALSTARRESDLPRIISGVSDGFTNGFPICAIIENENKKSSDYEKLAHIPRPNHADFPAYLKYGEHTELHGGGHFSGRLTAPLTFAGALCMQYLGSRGVELGVHVKQILNVTDAELPLEPNGELLSTLRSREMPTLDSMTGEAFATIIESAKNRGDSVGAILECAIIGLPPALGEHMFESVEAELSQLMFAIPGVKAISFGAGFELCRMYGSEANDAYEYRDGRVVTKTNNCGGIVGGMTTGMPIVFKVAMKPTPSIFTEQDSVDLESRENTKLTIKGRHDPCIAIRAVPVVESAAAIAITEMMLEKEDRKL